MKRASRDSACTEANLLHGLQKPDALLLDLDGVIADVEGSYRACILATARNFGVEITRADVLRATCRGNANNDWALTRHLLAERGVSVGLQQVTAAFQHNYLGLNGSPGLREGERMIVPREVLAALAGRIPIAIVTGRPRAEAEWFLSRFCVREFFRVIVAHEDAPNKPDPAPIRLALEQLRAREAWMVGDTVDDVRAAHAAGVVALGIVAPGDSHDRVTRALLDAGTAFILDKLADLLEVL